MKTIKHMIENPFIAGAGIAALAHSTWSLGTLFSGIMPEITLSNLIAWFYWFIPAFLIAFALDVGQVSTSAKIRHEGLTWRRAVTFFIFSIATYYLQFLYIAHHMPALQIEAGISELHMTAVRELRNAAIWILPALLPLATLLYTLSDDDSEQSTKDIPDIDVQIIAEDETVEFLPIDDINLLEAETFNAVCECGWQKEYTTDDSATRGLRAHQQKCSIYQEYTEIEA